MLEERSATVPLKFDDSKKRQIKIRILPRRNSVRRVHSIRVQFVIFGLYFKEEN
jgi:hypothetical protein